MEKRRSVDEYTDGTFVIVLDTELKALVKITKLEHPEQELWLTKKDYPAFVEFVNQAKELLCP